MGAYGLGLELLAREAEAGLEPEQAVLEVAELLCGHHLHTCELLQLQESRILAELALAPIVAHAKPRLPCSAR